MKKLKINFYLLISIIGVVLYTQGYKHTKITLAQGQTTPLNTCSSGKPCAESYSIECTTSKGEQGIKECHKRGCSPDGTGGPHCSWGPGSYCDECKPKGSPGGGNDSRCKTAENSDAGDCVRGADGRCWPGCRAGWRVSQNNISSDTVECKKVTCNCGNNIYCCRDKSSPPPQQPPPGNPPPQPPPGNPPPQQPPPENPPPTPTPTVILVNQNANEDNIMNERNEKNESQPSPGYTWVCLKSEYYDGPIGSPNYTNHKLRLTGNFGKIVSEIYIVGCVETSSNYYCTTGDTTIDQRLRISKLEEHTFKILNPTSNPFTINSNEIKQENNVIVYSTSQNTYTHKFYAVFPNEIEGIEGEESSIQYGTLVFQSSAETVCVFIVWDPQGKVLEYPNLKPLSNIQLTLKNKNKQLVKKPFIKNPIKTDKDGKFDFQVEDGEYILEIKIPKGYKIETNPDRNRLNRLQKNYVIYTPNMIINTKEFRNKEIIVLLKKKNLFENIFELLKSKIK